MSNSEVQNEEELKDIHKKGLQAIQDVKMCAKDRDVICVQEKPIQEILKTLERMSSNMDSVKMEQKEIRSDLKATSEMIKDTSANIANMLSMFYSDKIETLKQFSAQDIKINDNAHKIDEVSLQSEIENVNQNLNLANQQLNATNGKINWWKKLRDKGLLSAIAIIGGAVGTWVVAKFIAMQKAIELLNDIPK